MNNLKLNEIVELYRQNKLISAENVPGDNADYDDGWEDEEGIYSIEDLLDLILYLSGNKNLVENADEMLGLQKKDCNKNLQNLLKVFNDCIEIVPDENKFLLYGNISESTCATLFVMKTEYLKHDKNIVSEKVL